MAAISYKKQASPEELKRQNEELRQAIAERDITIAEQSQELQAAKLYLETLKRLLFGKKSERVAEPAAGQGLLFNEAEADGGQAAAAAPAEAAAPEPVKRTKAAHSGRRRPAGELKRVEVIHELCEADSACPWCNCPRPKIGEERSEEYEVIPAQVIVKVHVRAKYGPCQCDDFAGHDEPAIVTAPGPVKIAPGSLFSNGTAAFIIVNKFCDGLPLYRQEALFARMGLQLARGTMARLVIRVAKALEPLLNGLRRDIRGSPVLGMDETEVQVLKEDGRPPSAPSRMWIARGYTADELAKPLVWFAYHDSRSGDVAEAMIGSGFSGFLQTDGYAGYKRFGKRPDIVHVGCWAHIRRKFHEQYASAEASPLAATALDIIRKLYAIERRWRTQLGENKVTQDEFLAGRRAETEPIFDEFLAWLQTTFKTVPERGGLGQAISYALGQFRRAIRYVDHWLLTPDNNAVENAIRPFVIGRNNWQFMDTPAGAAASACLYSLIETAKANGHEPYSYLCHLFTALPLVADDPAAVSRLLPYRLDPKCYQAVPTG
jgi:transposase